MSRKIQNQFSKLWQILSDPKTVNSYRDTVFITWQILKESAILFWLLACFILVVADWFWTNSIFAGRQTRIWIDRLNEPKTEGINSGTGKKFLEASKTSLANTISQARAQLGLPEKQEPVLTIPEKEQEPITVGASSSANQPSDSPPPASPPSPPPLPEESDSSEFSPPSFSSPPSSQESDSSDSSS